MNITQFIYLGCATAFLSLVALMVLRGRVSGAGIAIIGACAVTALWAITAAFPISFPVSAVDILDTLRLAAWLMLMVGLVGVRDRRYRMSSPMLLGAAFCTVVIGYEAFVLALGSSLANAAAWADELLRVGLGVGGLLAVENLLRNADRERRWRLWPLCIALGLMFAFELFLYADRLMMPGGSPILLDGRGLVGLLAVPLLAMAMARNREWRVDIHVSRTVVLHTAALVASGIFFLALAAVGLLVRHLGGAWGLPLQVLTLIGSASVLVFVLGTYDIRTLLKRAIAMHFFSHRFDYRTEWLRFADTVSQPGNGNDPLPVRIVRALAQILDSTSGRLWFREGDGLSETAGWNSATCNGPRISINDSFIAGFRDGTWIQERPSDPEASNWPRGWLAIPLSHGNALIGFVTLDRPVHSSVLDWESFDLLRAAGRQAASYLAEERSTRALLDARSLNEYSKRFTFLVHDIKNLASQLGLVVSNARRYINDPDFREDMLLTLEESVASMNRLVAQLHVAGGNPPPQAIEPDAVISNLIQAVATVSRPVEARLGAGRSEVKINADQFRSALSHLITNALEASPAPGQVVVESQVSGDRVTVDVVDSGAGMDDDFIRDELFRPFRSTKSGGLGIGVYQVREILRRAGGELEVISREGTGTIMRMHLPVYDRAKPIQTAA